MGIYKAKTGIDDDGKPVYGAQFAMTPGQGVDEDVVKERIASGEWVEEKPAGRSSRSSARGKNAPSKKAETPSGDGDGTTPSGDGDGTTPSGDGDGTTPTK